MLSWAAGSPPLLYYNNLTQNNQGFYIFKNHTDIFASKTVEPEPKQFWMVWSQNQIFLDCGAGAKNVGSQSTNIFCGPRELNKYYHIFCFIGQIVVVHEEF